jgi:predicted MFS family arabinose efflux permease
MIPVTFTTLIARLVPQDKYNTAISVCNSSGDLGIVLGPPLGGAAALLGLWAPSALALPIGSACTVLGRRGMSAVSPMPAMSAASVVPGRAARL